MSNIIYCPLQDLALGTDADQDIFRLNAGANDKLNLHYFEITTTAIAAAALDITLLRRTADGTGGTGATEVLANEDGYTITGALTTLVTTPGIAGDILASWRWEQLGPLRFAPTPILIPRVQEGGRIALHLGTNAASETLNGFVVWEEL